MPDVFVAKDRKKSRVKSPGPTNKPASKIREAKGRGLAHAKKISSGKFQYDHHTLAAFRYYPHRADFINKDPEEKVVLLLRKHPVTNARWISIAFLMFIAPAFLTVFPFFEILPPGFRVIAVLSWYLLTIAFVFEKFLSWFFHVNIVTDERVFDVDFVHLVYREMTDANIDQIQDVTVEIGSALRTVFNYGNVIIQTAAQIPQIEFEAVPEPDKVARILRELRIEEEVEKLEGRLR